LLKAVWQHPVSRLVGPARLNDSRGVILSRCRMHAHDSDGCDAKAQVHRGAHGSASSQAVCCRTSADGPERAHRQQTCTDGRNQQREQSLPGKAEVSHEEHG
jgi:hypothetical protein